MLIQLEQTYNKNCMKFIIDHVWIDFIWECKETLTATKSIISSKLWKIEGVNYLLFGTEFVIVGKKNEKNWDDLTQTIIETISDYLTTYNKVFDNDLSPQEQNSSKNLSELDKQIIYILKEKVQPSLEMHGGFIEFLAFDPETGKLDVKLQGACKNCESSEITLQMGIRNLMQYYIPEIKIIKNIE